VRTHRFASIDLQRTKTDAIDALAIARFAAAKQPAVTPLPDALTEELRELVHLRERLLQDFGDRLRQLHRLVDLGFPEFTRYVRTLDSQLAVAILRDYPTAASFRGLSVRRLAALRYDGRHAVGLDLARTRSTPPGARLGNTTAPPTACRSVTPVMTSMCCAAACTTSTMTSRASCASMKSAACSPPSMASLPIPRRA
jgi:hypothetical protein